MSAMENTLAAAPGNEEQLQELHRTMKARARRKNRTQKGVLLTLNTFMAIFMMLPLLYAISVALMPANELNSMAMNLVPSHPTLENVKNALSQVSLGKFILNSFIVAGCITIGQIITCSLAAFSFSFLEFKGKNLLFMLVMATMMVPGEATIISNYLTVSRFRASEYIYGADCALTDQRHGNLPFPSVLSLLPDLPL